MSDVGESLQPESPKAPQDQKVSEEPKVKVSDRRRFTPEGEARDPAEVDPEPEAAKASAPAAAGEPLAVEPEPKATAPAEPPARPAPPPEPPPGSYAGSRGIPPASFELLVLSLAMQAQMELGLGEPQEGHMPNLDIARHTIDLLAILQQKTKGNLTLDEQRLLENTLTELRYRYVQALDQINKQAKA